MYMADGQEILRSGGRDAPSVGQCGVHCLNVDNVELAACSMCGVHSSEDREVTPQLLGSPPPSPPTCLFPHPTPLEPHWWNISTPMHRLRSASLTVMAHSPVNVSYNTFKFNSLSVCQGRVQKPEFLNWGRGGVSSNPPTLLKIPKKCLH